MLFETIVLEWKIFIVFLINNNKIIDNDTHRDRTINTFKWESYSVSQEISLYNLCINGISFRHNYLLYLRKFNF